MTAGFQKCSGILTMCLALIVILLVANLAAMVRLRGPYLHWLAINDRLDEESETWVLVEDVELVSSTGRLLASLGRGTVLHRGCSHDLSNSSPEEVPFKVLLHLYPSAHASAVRIDTNNQTLAQEGFVGYLVRTDRLTRAEQQLLYSRRRLTGVKSGLKGVSH